MQAIPPSIRPLWRTIQIFQINAGLRLGLSIIVGPYIYEIFKRVCSHEDALFYTALLWAIYFGLIALLEIPTGALGDTIGRVRTTLLSLVILAVYAVLMTLLFFIHSFTLILIIGFITRFLAACFITLISGNFSAWIIDSIREREPNFGYERLLGKGLSLRFSFELIGSLLGITTYLYGVSYIAFFAIALLAFGCLSYCMTTMEETKSLVFLELQHTTWPILRKQIVTTMQIGINISRQSPIIGWFILLYAFYCLVVNITEYFWPIALGAQFGIEKWSPYWYMMIFFMCLVPAAVAYALAKKGDLAHKKNNLKLSNTTLRRWFMGSSFLAAIQVIILGLVNYSGVISFPLFAFSMVTVLSAFSIIHTSFETLVSSYMPDTNAQERATVLSIGSFLRGILVLLLLVPSRGSSDAMSPVGWMLPATLLLLVTIIAYWKIRKHEHNQVSVLSPQIQEVAL